MGERIGKVGRQVNPPHAPTKRRDSHASGMASIHAMSSAFDLEEALLGPLVAGRSCGDCVVCCEVLEVDTPDLRKRAGALCVHSTGRGCGIHATRPEICRAWFCGWRRIGAMPDEARPDLIGLLVSLDFNRAPRNCLEGVAIVIRSLDGGAALDRSVTCRIVAALSDGFVPIWLSDGATKTLVHPSDAIAAYVISGDPAPARLAGEVAVWRARYDVFR